MQREDNYYTPEIEELSQGMEYTMPVLKEDKSTGNLYISSFIKHTFKFEDLLDHFDVERESSGIVK